jgi:hypothetical protein
MKILMPYDILKPADNVLEYAIKLCKATPNDRDHNPLACYPGDSYLSCSGACIQVQIPFLRRCIIKITGDNLQDINHK